MDPGCSFICCCIDNVNIVNMRLQALKVRCETKTSDDVFVQVQVVVQYQVTDPRASFYELDDARRQIREYVFDVIRSEVPKLSMDQVFEKKNSLSEAVKATLTQQLKEFGFEILHTPVTDIDPSPEVKRSYNQIMTQKNLKISMKFKAEADGIVIKELAKAAATEIRIRAEADAEAKEQAGIGLSKQRKAIVEGLSDSVQAFQEGVKDVNAKTVMDLIMITQYFDMMEKLGQP
eukprot:UN23738